MKNASDRGHRCYLPHHHKYVIALLVLHKRECHPEEASFGVTPQDKMRPTKDLWRNHCTKKIY